MKYVVALKKCEAIIFNIYESTKYLLITLHK
jgi:hypothetical protein